MKLVIRADGGLEKGMGHIYRMLTLAEELRKDFDITFLVKGDEVVMNKVKSNGFDAMNISNDEIEIISRINPDIVIFDKFEVKEDVVRKIKERSSKIIFLFDNESTANKYADAVINAIVGVKVKDMDRKTYCGLKYLILRKEFHEYWKRKKRISQDIKKVLLIFGGSDPSNLTSKTLDVIQEYDFEITIVLGPHFAYFDELKSFNCKDVRVLRDINNVAELMYESDLVVTSLGLTTFEAFCTGTPAIIVCQNELQRKLCQYLSNLKLKYLLHEFKRSKLIEFIDELSDRNTRRDVSEYEKSVCDGKGLERVKEIVMGIV